MCTSVCLCVCIRPYWVGLHVWTGSGCMVRPGRAAWSNQVGLGQAGSRLNQKCNPTLISIFFIIFNQYLHQHFFILVYLYKLLLFIYTPVKSYLPAMENTQLFSLTVILIEHRNSIRILLPIASKQWSPSYV